MPAKSIATAEAVSTQVLAPYSRVLATGGGVSGLPLPDEAIADSAHWIWVGEAYAFAAEAAHRTGDSTLGVDAGLGLHDDDLGGFGRAVKRAVTVVEAGQEAMRTLSEVVDGGRCWVESSRGMVWFCYKQQKQYPFGAAQAEMFDLGMLVRFVRQKIGADWKPVVVRVASTDPKELVRHNLFAGCSVIRDPAVTAIGIDHLSAARPVQGSTDPVHVIAEVASSIDHFFTEGVHSTVDEVAQRLGVHTRAMQRELASNGTSFQALQRRAAYRMAYRYVAESELTLQEIAARMHYSGANNFSRAFQRMAGCTPGAMRNLARIVAK